MRLHPQTYALTSSTYERRRVFQRLEIAELMIATIFRYRDDGKFLVHGFVVMPDHIHVALTTGEPIEAAVKLIKGGFSFAVRNLYKGEIWNAGYHAHGMVDEEDYCNQLEYIANNPARKNYSGYPHIHTIGSWRIDPAPSFAHNRSSPGG
jgi:putative transposase